MKFYAILFICCLFLVAKGQAQTVTPVTPSVEEAQNVAIDLVILRGGKVLRAKVLEVTDSLIKYKKANYLNGPTYQANLADIYVINYANGDSEYFVSADSTAFRQNDIKNKVIKPKKPFVNTPQVSLGIGAIKLFSKGDETLSNLQQKSLLPSLFLRLSTQRSEALRVGLELGLASYRFEGDEFSSYDQVFVSGTATERVFSMSAYGQYTLNAGRFNPYILGGLGLNFSNINSEITVVPTENESNFVVSSGTQNTSLGVVLRLGAQMPLNDKMLVYADAGAGLSLLQAGIVFKK